MTSLLMWLQKQFPDSSNRTLRQWVKTGRVFIDGTPVTRADYPVKTTEQVTIGPKVSVIAGDIPVLYRDEHLICVHKPEGLLSVATDFDMQRNLHTLLKRDLSPKRVFPVHRLDKETSGVILFALSETARDRLKEQFEKREIEKTYVALLEGNLPLPKGSWQSYLVEEESYHVHSAPSGKLALTHYEVIDKTAQRTLVRLKPVTGRKHQLRVHCSDAGCPIVGDARYGGHPDERLFLHAQSIAFVHPISLKPLSFSVPLPSMFSMAFTL